MLVRTDERRCCGDSVLRLQLSDVREIEGIEGLGAGLGRVVRRRCPAPSPRPSRRESCWMPRALPLPWRALTSVVASGRANRTARRQVRSRIIAISSSAGHCSSKTIKNSRKSYSKCGQDVFDRTSTSTTPRCQCDGACHC